MYVVDSNDRERMGEVRDELWRSLAEEELKSALFLIMANKQDLPNAMSVEEVTETLGLHKIRDHQWRKLQSVCLSVCRGREGGRARDSM